jgi:hypothetical protein
VLAQASLDWSNFAWHVSGGLTISEIVPAYVGSSSFSETAQGPSQFNFGDTFSSAASSYITATGEGTSNGSAQNGALKSSSISATEGGSPSFDFASSDVFASTSFWLYGTGAGTLTVEVPYSLMIGAALDPTSPLHLALAAASVSIQLGPGAGFFASDSLSWQLGDAPLTKSGTLVVSKEFHEPTFGPLVFIGAHASTDAVTAVPEPSVLSLLGSGAAAVLLARRKKSRAL